MHGGQAGYTTSKQYARGELEHSVIQLYFHYAAKLPLLRYRWRCDLRLAFACGDRSATRRSFVGLRHYTKDFPFLLRRADALFSSHYLGRRSALHHDVV